jgi:uncharacterized membrane protein
MARPSLPRLIYLDWLRGLAVLVMVQAHVVDSWTQDADRGSAAYYDAVFIGGLGAPLFLLLAGVAVVLSASARTAASGDASVGRRTAIRRGVEVFVLALLFRVQSQLLGWGSPANLLKVDILNVMGISMIVAAWLWGLSGRAVHRIVLFALMTTISTMMTPVIRAWAPLSAMPDPIEAYFRPDGYYAAFTLFPWAGFLFAGALVGEFIVATRSTGGERRLMLGLLLAGAGGTLLAWWASFRPALYPAVNFWTSSPTFFFIRLGIITALVPAGWAHCRFWLGDTVAGNGVVTTEHGLGRIMIPLTRALELMGRSSLFVYWIHVEMVYGVAAEPLKRSLPLWGALMATLLLCVLLYFLVLVKNRLMRRLELPRPLRIFAAVLR